MYERMLDRQDRPTLDDMAAYCGEGGEPFIQINRWLSNEQFRSVYDRLEKETQDCIDRKYPCGDGGWLHYRVTSEAHYSDIQKLLEVKCAS